MKGEFEFYAGLSGLGAGRSLADHKLAYFRTQSGLGAGLSSVDYERTWLAGLYPTVGPDIDALRLQRAKALSGLPAGLSYADYATAMFAGGGGDVTPPTAGTLASSLITDTTFTLTVSGASDAGGLHAQPYRFSTDNGSTWSAWQTSPVFNVTGKTASTAYTCVHQTRDAALNQSTGSSIVVNTSAASLAYSAAVLADAPLGYWRLAEPSGTTITDSSGNARNGTYVGSPVLGSAGALDTDPTNTAVAFATGKYGMVANAAWMQVGSFTAEAWVKTLSANGQIMTRDDSSGGQRAWQLGVNGGVARLITWNGSDALQTALGVTNIADGNWHHVVGTADGTNIKIYVDGVLEATTAQGATHTGKTAPLSIAANASASPVEPLDGTLDELAFYNRALALAEIKEHIALRWTPASLGAAVRMWYDADDASTFSFSSGAVVSQWRDKSGNARHLAQGTVAAQPQRNGTINAKSNGVAFDGNDDVLLWNGTTVSTSPFTIVVVAKPIAVKANANIFDVSGAAGRALLEANPTSRWRMFAGSIFDYTTVPPASGTVYLASAEYNGASSKLRLNRAATASGDAGTNAFMDGNPLDFIVGRGQNVGTEMQVVIAELIVINGVLSTANRIALESYLSSKWGTP